MVRVKTETSYILQCQHCRKTIKVDKLERDIEGWRIDSNSIPIQVNTISDIKCPDCVQKEYDALYNSEYMSKRLQTRYYNEKGHDFYDDLIKELDIEGNPKKDKFISILIDMRESYHDIYYRALEIVELIR